MKLWEHMKRGGVYVVLDDEFAIEKTGERGVLYMNVQTGDKWVRPWTEFHDGRFRRVKIKNSTKKKVIT